MRKFIIAIITVSVFLGCEPLEEVPFSFLSVENLYQNEGDVDKALYGVYSSMNQGIDELWYFLATSGPGEGVVVRLKGDGNQGQLSGLNFQPTTAHGVWWNNFYRGINRANVVIEEVSNVGLEPSVEEQKIAEARFLRAWNYFNLVKWFGDVPLHLEATSDFSDESVKKPRSPIEEVYNVIIEDFQFAETRLPESWDNANLGRATSWAAKAYLGKVYLHMAGKPLEQTEMYGLAATKLQEVVNNGPHGLQLNFADIFSVDNEFNSEIIFARPNVAQNGAGSVLNFFVGAPLSPHAFNGGQYQVGFAESFYDSFAETDLRRDVTLLYSYVNSNGDTVTYNDPNNPGNLPFGGYNDPKGIGFGKLLDVGGAPASPFQHRSDFIFMRYGDVLLMLAEALNESGSSSEALPFLNQIRDRAGLDDVVTTNQSELRDIIKQERKWELAGEFTEYPDLQRWGDIEQSLQNNEDAQFFGTVYDPKLELFPIPQNQLDANENLTQNPGY
ncbi:RagB/SusD family nutrient uptake outer membrane protein [Flagellimonas marina]|uniref:RagB/SusD family nutrient uptake outer membrane protein n=1 Tax=Flagellimonas marina TaxID=1775168 RepID=A0ABV8PJX5_9FLAO